MTTNFPETTERFVAYFDVMGFKDFIYTNDHAVVSKKMNVIAGVLSEIKEYGKSRLEDNEKTGGVREAVVLPVMFSDSILFISRSGTNDDAESIIYAASYFLWTMFKAGIPVKGAIAYGEFTADFKLDKYFGRPLIDAYLLAEETHFYGSVLHHTIERYLDEEIKESGKKFFSDNVKNKLLPMKTGKVKHLYVDWCFDYTNHKKDPKGLISNFYKSASGSVRKYVDNTLVVYDENLI